MAMGVGERKGNPSWILDYELVARTGSEALVLWVLSDLFTLFLC